MEKMFIAYTALILNRHITAWIVFDEVKPVESGSDIEELCRRVEEARGWPFGSVAIVNFRRLEVA